MDDVNTRAAEEPLENRITLSDDIRERSDSIRGYVELVARQHTDVQAMATHAQDALGLPRESEEYTAGQEAEGLSQTTRLTLSDLEERLRNIEEFVVSLPALRDDLHVLSEGAHEAAARSDKINQTVLFTLHRLGGAEGLESLRSFPDRVAEEAKESRQYVEALVRDLERTMDERLEALVGTRLDEIGRRADRLLQSTEERLEILNGKLDDAESKLRKTWRREQRTYSRVLRQTIEAHQEAAASVGLALHRDIEAHQQAVSQAEAIIRDSFQRHVLQAVGSQVLPHLRAWDRRVDEARDHLSTHVEQIFRDADDKIMLVRSRMAQLEQHAQAVGGHVVWLERRGAMAAFVLAVLAIGSGLVAYAFRQAPVPTEGADAMLHWPIPEEQPDLTRSVAPEGTRFEAAAAQPEPPLLPVTDSTSAGPQTIENPTVAVLQPDSGYVWVAASTPYEAEAAALVRQHSAAGVQSRVYQAKVGGSMWYRVGIGFFSDARTARDARKSLTSWLPADAWITKVAGG